MKRTRRWAALALAAALCAGMLAGCGETGEAALTLPVCLTSEVTTLDPAYITTPGENTVVGCLYEPLMRAGSDGNGKAAATEGMAKKVDVKENADGTETYTFHLRSARWSDGQAVEAEDFVYAWQRLVNPLICSPNADLLSTVQGYDAVRAGADVSELAVYAKNSSTLEVTLSAQYPWFMSEICSAPATSPLRKDVIQTLKQSAQEATDAAAAESSEAVEPLRWWYQPSALVTNGAYQAADYQVGKSMELVRSERYYGSVANDGLHLTFAASPEDAWALYEKGDVDFVEALPTQQMAALKEEGQAASPVLSTYTVLFNANAQPLDDPTVRKALTLAVDRAALAAAWSQNAQAAQGLVPFGVPGDGEEDFRTAGGDLLTEKQGDYETDCQKARSLLSEGSYRVGSEMEYLYVESAGAKKLASLLSSQWRTVLGVKITPRAVTQLELDAALKSGKYALAGVSRTASANDAEAFLAPFASSSSLNVIGYANSAYDTLLSIIRSASDTAARIACLHDAEALLLQDNAVAPLCFSETAWRLRGDYVGLIRDARGWFSFSGVQKSA